MSLPMGVNMSNKPPPTSHTKDFLSSDQALSFSLAGNFDHGGDVAAAAMSNMEVVTGNKRQESAVEINPENSGPLRTRSDDDFEGEGEHEDDDDDDDGGGGGDGDKNKRKKRKKQQRLTVEQMREMETLFKESQYPDAKQRKQLSKQLGLAPSQVMFWFQNRRTQVRTAQERNENSSLKTELEKRREENKALRETINKSCCPNCGMANTSRDGFMSPEDQQLCVENATLKIEIEKLRAALEKYQLGTTSPSSSTGHDDKENRSSLVYLTGIFGLEKSRVMEIVNQAKEELIKMANMGEPLWVRNVETGREILNYDEYMKEFAVENSYHGMPKTTIEASRETGFVFVDLPWLLQSFLDVNRWKEMFPCSIPKAATVDVICNGEGSNKDGAVQLMFAELQMLTPMVPTREVYFFRFCKQLSAEKWAIVDVSIDKAVDNIDASLVKCRKGPSGCIIEDMSNGYCKVIWVEHFECQQSVVHRMYQTIVNSGLAFGARHWIATLQVQCERLVFYMATNVPMKDSIGVATLAGRKSILKLAQRMTLSFCHAIGASSFHSWNKVTSKTGEDIRIRCRKNLNDPGEPLGVILTAVSSVCLPVSPNVLFDFLRDEARRIEWHIMYHGGSVQSIANLAKGQDQGNVVNIQEIKSKENSIWLVQDSCTNAYESMVVYALVDFTGLQSMMTGCDSSSLAILPSGFSILPNEVEARPLVITSRKEEKNTGGGSLFTMAFQVLTNASPTAMLTMESVESVSSLVSRTLSNIRTSLQCEDG